MAFSTTEADRSWRCSGPRAAETRRLAESGAVGRENKKRSLHFLSAFKLAARKTCNNVAGKCRAAGFEQWCYRSISQKKKLRLNAFRTAVSYSAHAAGHSLVNSIPYMYTCLWSSRKRFLCPSFAHILNLSKFSHYSSAALNPACLWYYT